MGYFRELPDLQYQSSLPHKISSLDYVRVKNLFRRIQIREDLKDKFILFNKYQIPEGARPDTVAEEFYGRTDYDSTEVLDSKGRLILPSGQIVDSNFSIPDPDNKNNVDLNPVVGVTNYEYEVRKNDEKRSINLLRPEYLQQFLNDMRVIMNYDPSSQYVNNKLIKTENTGLTCP